MMTNEEKRYIVLEDGHVFEGYAFGAQGTVIGELICNNGMISYIETLTDPSYYGQIVMETFPSIGNYGMIVADLPQSKSHLSGYIVREWCDTPSNFRCETTIDTYLKANNVVGLYGIDTRELTQILREHGTMNATITSDPASVDYVAVKAHKAVDVISHSSENKKQQFLVEGATHTVALLDFGARYDLVAHLNSLGCSVEVFPYSTSAEEILASAPDGILLGNGAGDPNDNPLIVEQIKKLIGKAPIFGICLGHQLLALAQGGKVSKLHHAHRGSNQPVKNLATNRILITKQNHGYVVETGSVLPKSGDLSFCNVNDGTCEGLLYADIQAFSVQFLPLSCGGANDSAFLFDQFISMMGGNK